MRWAHWIGGIFVVGLIAGLPAGYASYLNANLRNVRIVKSEVLYRSGQLSIAGLERVVHDYDIRTVVSLRDSDDPNVAPPDAKEEEFCKAQDIRHVRITPRRWWSGDDSPPPADLSVATFLSVMDDASNYPVLVHCFAGTHRTGAMVAIYRMEYERWTNAEAIAELRSNGYKNLDREADVLGYLENYRPRWSRGPK
ncbi:MAG: fused DSP-PTPase phosphatase/NAD kinase-like protein [Gemmataceae bacterium]